MNEQILHFRTNILLKDLVGKDLINDDNIAIVELVKNSFDAESNNVLIEFNNFSDNGVSSNLSQLIIADEGSGMDLTDIQDKWLNIAYSEKKYLDQENGAFLAGNKGIGRFSCDRLGKQLILLTRKNGQDLLHMHIKWLDFEIEDQKDLTIQTVPINVQIIDDDKAAGLAGLKKFPDHGTILVISDLRSKWNTERLIDLKTSLEKFLNPNQLFMRDSFKITLSVPDLVNSEKEKRYHERINGLVENQIFDKLKFNTTYIEAKISGKENTVKVLLWHEGEKVFELIERNELYPFLEDAFIIIYYLNPYKKAYFKRQTGVRSVDFGSIFLFLNGFRIAPYGDHGNDWLGIDIRKGQGTSRYLGSREIVGRIEIAGSEEEFKPISSREGLKETPTFRQLRQEFFLEVLRKLEKFVVDGLDWDSVSQRVRQELGKSEGIDWENTAEEYTESWERKQQRIVTSIMTLIGSTPERIIKFWFNPSLLEGVFENRQEDVKNLLSEIEGFDPDKIDANLSKSINKFKKLLAKKESEARAAKSEAAELRVQVAKKTETINKLTGETETYRAQTLFFQQVTSLDVKQLLTYHHQINLNSHTVNNYIAKAIKGIQDIPNKKNMLEILQKASLANKRIAAIAQYATKANFRSGTTKEPTDIPAYIEQYLLLIAPDFVASNIKLEINNGVNELFEIKVSRIELSILIDNIISNSTKANAKKLTTSMSKVSDNTLRISFIDDGKGLSKELPSLESMFEAGITTTTGSGLGLFHAKNIVNNFGGRIEAIPQNNSGMEIRVEVTR